MSIDPISSVEYTEEFFTLELDERDNLHRFIFAPSLDPWEFTRDAELLTYHPNQDWNLNDMIVLAGSRSRGRNEPEINGEIGVTATWGDPSKEIEVSGYMKGQINDSNGNYIKGQYDKKDDGTNKITVAGGYDSTKKKEG